MKKSTLHAIITHPLVFFPAIIATAGLWVLLPLLTMEA